MKDNQLLLTALRVLIALRDSRALPYLLERLDETRPRSQSEICRLIVDLGDPAAIPELERIINDEGLIQRVAESIQARSSQELSAQVILDRSKRNTEELKNNARSARRDLINYRDRGIVSSFDLDDDTCQTLFELGFAVLPSDKNELYQFYKQTYPFVTVDSIFHTFMIMLRAGINEMEQLVLLPRVGALTAGLAQAAIEQAKELDDLEESQLADRNAAFLAVAAILCDSTQSQQLPLSPSARRMVWAELSLIKSTAKSTASPIFQTMEDYTEYKPRGRHSDLPEMEGYFQAMTWLGRASFPLESESATRQALLLMDLFFENGELADEWGELDDLLGSFFGERDDLALTDYRKQLFALTGGRNHAATRRIRRTPDLLTRFREELATKRQPRISSTRGDRTAGLRLFGKRYTRSIHLFQQYMDAKGASHVWPPSGLHVAAELLGSDRAHDLLTEEGYRSGEQVFSIPPAPADRFSSLAEGMIYCHEALFDPPADLPEFMYRPDWEEKEINSSLGAWAEMRHSISLYSKSAHMTIGASRMVDRIHGYVEPYPEFFHRLDVLLQRVRAEFKKASLFTRIELDRGIDKAIMTAWKQEVGMPEKAARPGITISDGSDTDRSDEERRRIRKLRNDNRALMNKFNMQSIRLEEENLEEFSSILKHLGAIAEKALRGEPQNVEDGMLLKTLGLRLKHLSFNRSDGLYTHEPMSLITDVASEYQSGECLEVGVGRPLTIYVLIPFEDHKYVCKGAIYSYYEFLQPIGNRLNDRQWRELSQDPEDPDYTAWAVSRPWFVGTRQ